MSYFCRRSFIKKIFSYGFIVSLSVMTLPFFFREPSIKFISEKFYLMGTHGKIQIFVKDIDYGMFVIRKAIDRIRDIELSLTKFSPGSDVGFINTYPFVYHQVSSDTLFVLNFGKQMSFMTDGYFDMGLGNVLSSFGIDEVVPVVGECTDLDDVKGELFSVFDNQVRLIRSNTMIDLGGIGKGYALDEAMKVFLNYGIKHVAIEFGGDIKVNGGMPSGHPWLVSFDERLSFLFRSKLNFIKINTGSIAVSGGYLKKSDMSGFSNHHIVDPKSLSSRNDYFLVIVSGDKSIICDSLATACYCMDYTSLCKVKTVFSSYNVETYI